MKVKEMTAKERPREKAIQYGVSTLSNRELIAILLRSGSKQQSALELADELLNVYGGLGELSNASMAGLMEKKGIKEVKAIQLLACFELSKRITREQMPETFNIDHPKKVLDWLNQHIGFCRQEHFLVLFLNIKNSILGCKALYIGTTSGAKVEPKEVFQEAIQRGCQRIICVHNHPSGDVTPSHADIMVTRSLQTIGNMVGIELLDHIIVGKNNYTSLRENVLLD